MCGYEVIKYHKLVRDNIPDIIAASGKKCVTERLEGEAYLEMLEHKLSEELAEYQESKSVEELADLLEVIIAVAKARGSSIEQVEAIRKAKAMKRGGFEKRILLKEVWEHKTKQMIFQKSVDWSVFVDGFAIPLAVQEYFQNSEDLHTVPGQSKSITLVINNTLYGAELRNLANMTGEKRTPRIQVRYRSSDLIAMKFREIFGSVYSEMVDEKERTTSKSRVKNTSEAYFDMFATDDPYVFMLECHQ